MRTTPPNAEERNRVLSPEERRRYSRHLLLSEIGEAGQLRLKQARALVVGAGGLGSPAALYLAAAGVGTLGIADADAVEVSNLQRQILHAHSSVGALKTDSARARLEDLNPLIAVETHPVRLARSNAMEIIAKYDLVLDGADNFATRYLLNDACALAGKPLVYGAVAQFSGQVSFFDARRGFCYRCLYPAPPKAEFAPNCAESGVLGVVPGVIGALQATEALKFFLGVGENLLGKLMLFDALTMEWTTLLAPRAANCPLCGERPSITALQDYDELCQSAASANAGEQNDKARKPLQKNTLSVADFLRQEGEFLPIDLRESHELALGALPRSLHAPLSSLLSPLDYERLLLPVLSSGLIPLFYCASGARSERALAETLRLGLNARHLSGGFFAFDAQRANADKAKIR
jgi:adenylyltransferase/sulfurtransferase